MIHPRLRRGWASLSRRFRLIIGAMLIALPLPILVAADDPYLQMLDEEVTKVRGRAADTGKDGGAREASAGGMEPTGPAPSRENFEAMLRKQHAGTYSFYDRLSERSREEVFADYRNGASMEVLRDKVVDRYLHP